MRRYFIDKIENMRDIGGYITNNKRAVREKKIIRSNVPVDLSENELKELENMGFSTIIDLRSDEEVEKKQGVFFDNSKFNYNHIKINGDGRIPESSDKVLDSYIEMLEGKEQIKKIFEIISNTDDGIIYYCNAGKDRTGVVTALILRLLGVNEEDIVTDYMASGIFLKDTLENFAKSIKDKDVFQIINPNRETMFNLLKYIDSAYGSVEGYLLSCGLEMEALDRIKEKYTKVVAI